jgi:hypothetical protein
MPEPNLNWDGGHKALLENAEESTQQRLPGGVGQFEDDTRGKHEPNSGNRSADSVKRARRREWRSSGATAAKISWLGGAKLFCTTE